MLISLLLLCHHVPVSPFVSRMYVYDAASIRSVLRVGRGCVKMLQDRVVGGMEGSARVRCARAGPFGGVVCRA